MSLWISLLDHLQGVKFNVSGHLDALGNLLLDLWKYQCKLGLTNIALRTGLRRLVHDGITPEDVGQAPWNTRCLLRQHCSRTRRALDRKCGGIFLEFGGSQAWPTVPTQALRHRSTHIWLPYSQNTVVHHRVEEGQIFLVPGL